MEEACARGAVRDDGEDGGIALAERRAARRRAADLDLRQIFAAKSLDDHDVAVAQPIFTFQEIRKSRLPGRRAMNRAPASGHEHRRVRAGRLVALRVLALDVRLVLVVRVLERADLQPILHERLDELHGHRRLARLVRARDEEHRGRISSSGIEQVRPPVLREARLVFPEAGDPGVEGLPGRDQPSVRRGARQEVDRRDVVAVLVFLGPPAEAVRIEVEERLEEPQVRLVRAEERGVRDVHLHAPAALARVLLERGLEDVRAEDDSGHAERVRGARPRRPRRATARREARTAASSRAPPTGSSPRRGSRPGRRAPSPASACSATGGPRRASPRSRLARERAHPSASARP